MNMVLKQPMSAEDVTAAIDHFYAQNSHEELGMSLKDACATYNKVAPTIKIALPFIKIAAQKIPNYGTTIASALDTILFLADMACPVPALADGPRSVPARANLVSLQGEGGEDTDYSSFKIENGYGLLNKVGASVTLGAEVDVDVNFKILTLTDNSVKQWFDDVKSTFKDSERHTLEENYAAGGFAGGLLLGCFGCLFGAGTYNHYKNQTDDVDTSSDTTKQGYLKTLHQMQKSYVNITGHMKLTGQSAIPTEAFVFLETTTITFKDGSTISVVSTASPVVADARGDTSKVSGTGTIRTVPLG